MNVFTIGIQVYRRRVNDIKLGYVTEIIDAKTVRVKWDGIRNSIAQTKRNPTSNDKHRAK